MGIRFDCPNGHTLNVKSFLAGKKGICPHCGAKFRIPPSTSAADDGSESDMGPPPDEGKPNVKAMQGAPPVTPKKPAPKPATSAPQAAVVASGAPAVTVKPAAVTAVAAVPTGLAVGAAVTAVPTPAAQPGTLADAVRAVSATAAAAAPAGTSAAGDPIAEAPTAIWYVRPPGGGQYGPARGDLLQQWVAEGRVTPPSLVWREGWADWKVASDIFPSLASPAAPAVSDAAPIDVGVSTRKTARYIAKKKSTNTLAVGGIIILVLLVVGLVVALAFVLSNSGKTETSQRRTKMAGIYSDFCPNIVRSQPRFRICG